MSINIVTLNSPAMASPNPTPRIAAPLAGQNGALPLLTDPVIDLLKKLLPVDRPVGTVLEEFRQASMLMMESKPPQDEAFVNLIALIKKLPLELKNLTADQLHSILERLGLRYEPMIRKSLEQGFPLTEERLTAENLKAALLSLLKNRAPDGTTQEPSSPAMPRSDPAGGEVREQAEQLLSSIERTQVLNSVNYEKGHPLTFQIPFVLDGRTQTAEFYVDQRDGESPEGSTKDRHYTVVALLELGGLGPLRIDLTLHKTHLSVRVTVEHAETERFTRGLLPELKQALDRQGFVVDFLSCERRPDDGIHGEDITDGALPAESRLISFRI